MMQVRDFARRKDQGRKISMVTCYDYSSARAIDQSNVDCILIDDAVATAVHGHRTPQLATTAMIAAHTAAVARGAPSKFIVADMPFLSYRKGLKEAMDAVHELVSAGAHAVKLKGVFGHEHVLHHIVDSGVPILGHLSSGRQITNPPRGLKPRPADNGTIDLTCAEARELEEVGCIAIVLEGMSSAMVCKLTELLKVPTLAMNESSGADGAVMSYADLLGLNPHVDPEKKSYAKAFSLIQAAVDAYDHDVKNKRPGSSSNSETKVRSTLRLVSPTEGCSLAGSEKQLRSGEPRLTSKTCLVKDLAAEEAN